LLKEKGRQAEPFEFAVAPTASATPDDIKRYRDVGVDELDLAGVFQQKLGSEADIVKLLEDLARKWVDPAAKL
jgi:hypothetical protein